MADDEAGQATERRRETYAHGHHESVLRSHRWRSGQNSAAYLLPHLRPGLDLLDVGCGPGTITVDLALAVAPGRVLGVDRSAEVLHKAAELAVARDAGNAVFEQADAYDLPYAAGSFDVVHAHQVLQHLADPVAALREMRRVCKPGGVVAARDGDYTAMTWYPADPLLDRWIEIYRLVARANDGEPDAGRFLLAWSHAAGFSDVRSTATAWCYASPEDRAWWGELWADRMTKTAVGDQAVEIGASTRAELDAIAEAWRRWIAHPDGWFAVLSGEILARA
jgi:ubiquinone/menaquinone biosynthesis C-methylase UbiE